MPSFVSGGVRNDSSFIGGGRKDSLYCIRRRQEGFLVLSLRKEGRMPSIISGVGREMPLIVSGGGEKIPSIISGEAGRSPEFSVLRHGERGRRRRNVLSEIKAEEGWGGGGWVTLPRGVAISCPV